MGRKSGNDQNGSGHVEFNSFKSTSSIGGKIEKKQVVC
jgi:hypothetical protein